MWSRLRLPASRQKKRPFLSSWDKIKEKWRKNKLKLQLNL
jgi:hypothetical protein